MEATATLRGQACNTEVSLSHSLLLIEDAGLSGAETEPKAGRTYLVAREIE